MSRMSPKCLNWRSSLMWKFELTATAFRSDQLPVSTVPEIALLGRSNVGKSTMINALLNRTSKKIAHVSSNPGKTRSLNFYKIDTGDLGFFLVDLPGYGYAARSADERVQWRRLIEGYFGASEPRRTAFVIHLVDFRHGMQKADQELSEWLDEFDMPRLVAFTKADKVPNGQKKQLYIRYLSAGMKTLAPPPLTTGRNDDQMERLRRTIEDALIEVTGID